MTRRSHGVNITPVSFAIRQKLTGFFRWSGGEMDFTIYGLYTFGDTQFRYVGVSKDVSKRKKEHLAAQDSWSIKSVWMKALKVYGLPLLSRRLAVAAKEDRFSVESKLIKAFADRGHPVFNGPEWKKAHEEIPAYVISSWSAMWEMYLRMGGPFREDCKGRHMERAIHDIQVAFPSLCILSRENMNRSKWNRGRLTKRVQDAEEKLAELKAALSCCAGEDDFEPNCTPSLQSQLDGLREPVLFARTNF